MGRRMPQHIRQIRDNNRRAHAPYNFVPLPERIVVLYPDANDLPDHSVFPEAKERYDGWIDVTLATRSPLYIRGPMTQEQFEFQEKELDVDGRIVNDNTSFRRLVRNLPSFFHTDTDDPEPVIPGSSLRGMLRNVFEIVTYSKIKWVTDRKPVFRALPPVSLGQDYIKRVSKDAVETGFIVLKGMDYEIVPCTMWRLHFDHLEHPREVYSGKAPNQTPKWNGKIHQHMKVWVKSNNGRDVSDFKLVKTSGYREGRLVLSGDMFNKKKPERSKKHHYVFLLPEDGVETIAIDEAIWKRFHDDDQISQWQQNAFPVDKPFDKARKSNGAILTNPQPPGDPVFFLRENDKLTFFGRAMMFRLPYQRSPLDLVPKHLRIHRGIDMTEAVFGYVRTKKEQESLEFSPDNVKQGDKRRAYAGRIFVTDARLMEDTYTQFEQPIEPHILSGPKPTTFQHYLTQNSENERSLTHYDSPGTTIRGHKLYWHQGEVQQTDIADNAPDNSTQHTVIQPLDRGNRFHFKIYFENLDVIELGALLWTLKIPGDPNREYCHKLGMGKSLGLGAVKLEAEAQIIDRRKRYETLFDDNGQWEEAIQTLSESEQTLVDAMDRFETFMLQSLQASEQSFTDIERIQCLLRMMEWRDQVQSRPYMELTKFKRRPVLPHPLDEL